MRKVNKGVPCEDFEEFNKKPHTNWSETEGRSRIWREHILKNEQAGMSGYTETPVSLDSSHIDHFRKQVLFQDYIFRWENYIVDSLDEDYGAKYKDRQISTRDDNLKLINPVEEDAERFFYYEATGKMIPAPGLNDRDKERARFTIEKFNLNHSSLKERRRLILNLNLDSYKDYSDDELLQILSADGFISVAQQTVNEWKETKNDLNDDKQ